MYFPPCGIRTCTRGRPEQTPRVPEREHSLNIIAQYFYRLRRALSYTPDSQRMLTFLYASIDVCFFIEHPRANGRFSPPSLCDDTALFPSTGAYIALSLFQYRNELFLISLYKRTSLSVTRNILLLELNADYSSIFPILITFRYIASLCFTNCANFFFIDTSTLRDGK